MLQAFSSSEQWSHFITEEESRYFVHNNFNCYYDVLQSDNQSTEKLTYPTLYKANNIFKKVFIALCFAPIVMGRTLTLIESNNVISEKCFILMGPPSVHRISIELFNLKVYKN